MLCVAIILCLVFLVIQMLLEAYVAWEFYEVYTVKTLLLLSTAQATAELGDWRHFC